MKREAQARSLYKQVHPGQDVTAFATRILETLLRNLAFSIHQTLEKPSDENIRELRADCLRLRHAVRLFARVFPSKAVRKIERRVRGLRDLVVTVYAHAAAIEGVKPDSALLAAGGGPKMVAELEATRRRSLRPLRARMKKMQQSESLTRWRKRLAPSA